MCEIFKNKGINYTFYQVETCIHLKNGLELRALSSKIKYLSC